MLRRKAVVRCLPFGIAMFFTAVFVCPVTSAQEAKPALAVAQKGPASSSGVDQLAAGFVDPPNSARPRVWWHWMNGNITTQGIDLDLSWMKRIGIGGFTAFDIAMNTPTIVDKRLVYMTPDWKSAFQHALAEAEAMGFEVTIASSPGWSETGGPWVPPSQAMKKLVWSETEVTGGRPFVDKLPLPPQVAGYFQDLGSAARGQFYADVDVFAYPITVESRSAVVKTNDGKSLGDNERKALEDGILSKAAVTFPIASVGNDSWIQFEYDSPKTIQAVALSTMDDSGTKLVQNQVAATRIESSDDGVNFREVEKMPSDSSVQHTTSFAPVTAKFFRVMFRTLKKVDPAAQYKVAELKLFGEPRTNDFERKAGFEIATDYYAIAIPAIALGSAISSTSVIDLKDKMSSDGTLSWSPPPGRWRVVRMGCSLTGRRNGPAPPEATGFEVDKLSRPYVEAYLNRYLSSYSEFLRKDQMGTQGIRFMLTDSTETKAENWTDDMLEQFRAKRGYDATPWLPALTGAVIETPEATDHFLWDYRRTIAELVSESHYDTIAANLHAHGMGYYGEALESGRPQLGDDLEMRRSTDIPMGAMWTFSPKDGPRDNYVGDLLGAASVAHVYGKNLVGAESLTSMPGHLWSYAPSDLKPVVDLEFVLGVNRVMIHETALQPLTDKKPGLTLSRYGQTFNRNETWAEQAKPWIDYLARCSYLLQQGRFVGEVAYFYGEEAPLDLQFAFEKANLPKGYGYDFVNSDIILHQLSVDNGRLITHSGANYGVLYLGGTSRHMTLPVLQRLLELVRQGATIAGSKPVDSPSLSDRNSNFQQVADELFGPDSAVPITRQVGKGRVFVNNSAAEALHKEGVSADWSYHTHNADADIMFLHRDASQGDIYFVTNRKQRNEEVVASFAVAERTAELWMPDTGERENASYSTASGRTVVHFHLDPSSSVFVFLPREANKSAGSSHAPIETVMATLAGNWKVSFEPGLGAPKSTTFDRLSSWTENKDPGIQYFSGHATYEKTITVDSKWLSSTDDKTSRSIWLDLGDVKDLAEVSVNDKPLGIVWKEPFRVDVTGSIRPGENRISVRVVNLWVNRLIGDQRHETLEPITFADVQPYGPDTPLLPSGLLGPVQVIAEDSK